MDHGVLKPVSSSRPLAFGIHCVMTLRRANALRADLALDNLQRAVEFMPNLYRELALTDSDLTVLRKQQRFEALIQD